MPVMQRKILIWLCDVVGIVSTYRIAWGALGASKSSRAYYPLKKLVERGFVEKTDSYHYQITERGRAFVAENYREKVVPNELAAAERATIDNERLNAEHSIGIKALALLARITGWDHFDAAGDGAYWRDEIQKVLGDWRKLAAGEREATL